MQQLAQLLRIGSQLLTFSKWQNYRDGEHVSDCQRLETDWGCREGGRCVAVKGQDEGSFWWQNCLVS